MINKIDKYLNEHYEIKDNVITVDLADIWDYQLSDCTIEMLLDYAGYTQTYDYDLESYLYDYYDYDLFIDAIYVVCPNIDDDAKSDLYNELLDKYKVVYDVNKVLKANRPSDLVLYFGSNWDDDYMNESCWHNDEQDNSKSLIVKLIHAHGYTVDDLFDENKRSKSEFLTSVYEELYDYRTDLCGMQLIAIPDSTDWKTIYEISNNKRGIIKAGTSFGLFNRIHGSGCGLSIVTEKDIKIEDIGLYEVSPFFTNNAYDYSPEAVYGKFVRKNEEQLSSYFWSNKRTDNENLSLALVTTFDTLSESLFAIHYKYQIKQLYQRVCDDISYDRFETLLQNITVDDLATFYDTQRIIPSNILDAYIKLSHNTKDLTVLSLYTIYSMMRHDIKIPRNETALNTIKKWLQHRPRKTILKLLDALYVQALKHIDNSNK